jgi:hypothetical protein
MWTTYSYVCTSCDALIQVTTQFIPQENASCVCDRRAWVTQTAQEPYEDVTSITYVDVVKINTNPYN